MTNSRYQDRLALFEVGPIFIVDEDEILPTEQTRLSLVMSGHRTVPGWQNGGSGTYDFFDLKGVVEALFNELHLNISYEPLEHPTYRPGRTARLLLGETQVGVMGELHPLVVEQFDLQTEQDQPVLAADIDVDALIAHIPGHYPYDPISPYPAVHEDIAVVVDKHVAAKEVEDVIRSSGGFLLKDVALFDLYEGSQIGAGKKSLAYHLTFQAPDKTLTDKVVQKSRQKIVGQLKHRLNAQLRE